MIGNLRFGDGARLKLRQSFASSAADANRVILWIMDVI
jgi:hypothetical protein